MRAGGEGGGLASRAYWWLQASWAPPPPVFLCELGPLPGGPPVRGCLQIIREQIRKEGGKKALRRQTGSLSSGAGCQRQQQQGRSPARRPGICFAAARGEEGTCPGCWGGGGIGWSVLGLQSLRTNGIWPCPGGGLDTKAPGQFRLALGPSGDNRRGGLS